MDDLDLTTRKSYSSALYTIEEFGVLGTCEKQEDATGGCIEGNTAVMVLCDGIGGLERGELASQKAVSIILERANEYVWKENPIGFLDYLIDEANNAVFGLSDETGTPIQGGCTLVVVLLVGRRLYWANVGDSRAYIIKKEGMLQLTKDHNYAELLKLQLEQNVITQEEYAANITRGAALTGYIGMGELKERYVCNEPILLDRDEVILLETDGLYKLLEEEEIAQIVRKNVRSLDVVGEELLSGARRRVTNYQDNTSILLLRIK